MGLRQTDGVKLQMIKTTETFRDLLYPVSSNSELKEKPAVIETSSQDPKGWVVTYQELNNLTNDAENQMFLAKVKKGDRVIMTGPNSARLLATILAAFRLSITAVPVDFRIIRQLANVTRKLDAKVLFATSTASSFKTLNHNLTAAAVKVIDLDGLSSSDGNKPGKEPVEPDLNSPAFIILTSGTTGDPKGAIHDLGSLLLNIREWGEFAKLKSGVKGIMPLPLSHIFGLEVTCICTIFGGSAIFADLSPNGFFRGLNQYQPQILVGVPAIYSSMVGLPDGALNLSQAEILLSGGAPLPPSLAAEFNAKYGKRLNNGYGSTESKIVALNLDGPPESVGKIINSAKIDIVDAQDQPFADGELGEIKIAGPILMKGYLGQTDETAKVLKDGHYYTGDLGFMKNGYLYVSGRTKEMIIVAGNKVFPAEVESVMRKHDLVEELAVVGEPHTRLGQTVKAIVVIKQGAESSRLEGTQEEAKTAREEVIASLRNFAKDNLKRELRPMSWEIRPASKPLPRTPKGGIDKKVLEKSSQTKADTNVEQN